MADDPPANKQKHNTARDRPPNVRAREKAATLPKPELVPNAEAVAKAGAPPSADGAPKPGVAPAKRYQEA